MLASLFAIPLKYPGVSPDLLVSVPDVGVCVMIGFGDGFMPDILY